MLNLALTFWKPIAGLLVAVALVLVVLALKHSYDDARREEGAAPIRAEFEAYKKAAMERTTEITLAWNQKRLGADAAGRIADDERAKRLAESKRRVQALPPAVAAAPVPATALGVLDAAIDAGNPAATAGPAGPPAGKTAAAPEAAATSDGTIGLLIDWGVGAIDAYNHCRDVVAGWQAFYAGLQAAQEPMPAATP